MRGLEQIPWLYDATMALCEPLGLGGWRLKLVTCAQGRILEVGCGTGRNLLLYPEGSRVVGLEPELDALLAARRRAPGVPLVMGSVESLPFAVDSFDTILSSLVFCSVPNPHRGLCEIGRVLHSEGRLCMMEHVRHPNRFYGRFQDVIQPFWTWLAGGCHLNRDTEESVQEAGFRIDPASRRGRGVMRRFTAFRG
jgi:ubiquinone/menaquinone biosynthesis C-methylase UbiE